MVCVIFIHKWRDLQFKVRTKDFWETFHDSFNTLRVFARNLLRGNRRKNAFSILFCCLAWGWNAGFTSNKPTHYLLDNGDFQHTPECEMCFIAEENFVQTPISRIYNAVNGQLASVVAWAGLNVGVYLNAKYAIRCRKTVVIPEDDEETTHSDLWQHFHLQ